MASPPQRSVEGLRRIKDGLDERDLLQPLVRICRRYNVTLEEVLQRIRTKRVSQARDACIVHILGLSMSMTEVAKILGMHHTSIAAARDRYADLNGGATKVA